VSKIGTQYYGVERLLSTVRRLFRLVWRRKPGLCRELTVESR